MTRGEIEAVFERVRGWPEDRQAYAAFVLLDLEKEYEEPYVLTDEERADLDEALREEKQGEFTSEEEVEALFARYRGQ